MQPNSSSGKAFAALIHSGSAHADRALMLEAGNPEALAIRGVLAHELWWTYPTSSATALVTAERDLRAAVDAKPSLAIAWYTLSRLYHSMGRFAEADQAARKALEADAYFSDALQVMSRLFFTALDRGDQTQARYWCREGRRRFAARENFIDCELTLLGWFASTKQDAGTAWRLLEQVERSDSAPALWASRRMMVAAILARSGLRDSATAVIRVTRDALRNEFLLTEMAYPEAYVRLLLGERDEAIRLIRLYLEANPTMREYTSRSPWFQPLHDDPRFGALVHSAK
jgi:tetratricopeptide (TPR) repeat protein